MKSKKIIFTSEGYELVGILDIPNKTPAPGVILFHGLTNSKDDCPLIKEVAEALTKEGFITFRFDFYGSGESPGKLKGKTWSISEQNARDSIEYFKKTKKVTEIGLWGRSTGGTIEILCSDYPWVKAFAFATTPVLLKEAFLSRFERVRKLELELEKDGKNLPGTGKYKGEFSFSSKFFEEVPLFEEKVMKNLAKMSHVLVLATTPDTKVPLKDSTIIINTVKEPKEIHIFEGIDHDYKGVEEKAVDLAVSWFKKYLGGGKNGE